MILFLFSFQYQGKEYKYHEPNQSPITPPYEEAIALLEKGRLQLKKPGASLTVFNQNETSISAFKDKCNISSPDPKPEDQIDD